MKSFRLLLCLAGLLGAFVPLPAAPGETQLAARIARQTVAGIDVIAYPTAIQEVVTLSGSLPAGDCFSPAANPAVATLTGEMLDQGTTLHDKFAIAQQLENDGATLTFSVGDCVLSFQAKCLKKDLPLVVALLAEQLRTPAFAPEELAKTKARFAGAMRRQLEDTDTRARTAFLRAIYPAGHPNRPAALEDFIAAIDGVTLEDVQAFHARHYGPRGMILVAVGDLEVATLQREVAQAFAGWTGGAPWSPPAPTAAPTASSATVYMADKSSVSIVLGQTTGLRYQDPEALALRLGTAVLGSGFTSRLVGIVRDREGLTYGIGARVAGDTFTDGHWKIVATFGPALLAQGIASTQRELRRWYAEGITEEEFANRQTNLIGSYKVGLTTTEGLASTLLATAQRGLPMSWVDEYPLRVAALTRAQVNAALRRHLHPETMALVQAGTVPAAR